MHPRLQIGVEWNPRVDELNPLLNAHLMTETRTRPALIVGTSSDRIGTPSGTAYYATLSKDLSPWLKWPIAPYAGVSYGTFEDRARFIGGLSAALGGSFSGMFIWDGVNPHLSAGVDIGRWNLSALLIDLEDPGLSASVRF